MNKETFQTFDARLQAPFTMVLAGPSSSGKSTFLCSLLKNTLRLINTEFDYIVCFLGSSDTKLSELVPLYGSKITFVEGLPKDFNSYINSSKNGLIVLDDLMSASTKDPRVAELYTKTSHHENVSVCLVLQDIFHHGKERLSVLRNTNYLVLFINPLDRSVIHALAHRIDPVNKRAVIRMILYAQTHYRYLLLDGKQGTLPEARYRTDIFNDFQRCFIIN